MSETKLALGLLLDDLSLQHRYRQLLELNNCQLAGVFDAGLLTEPPDKPADAWLVALGQDLDNPVLQDWLQSLQQPVIFDDASLCGEVEWTRRLSHKLMQLAGMIQLAAHQGSQQQLPCAVWVLAASTGGPAAVKAFLQALPPDLGLAFVYAQHIDQGFDVTLAQVISRNAQYPALLAHHGAVLAANSVLILRPDQMAEVQANGTLVVHQKPWGGVYRPAINQVIANVASVYGARSGAIIFTGMGDDGKAALRLMKQQGGRIWAQRADSCTVSSMPDEACATGCVSEQGNPEQLAQALAALYRPQN